MSNQKSLLKVGYVSKPHGIKGEVFVQLLNRNADWPNPIKELVIGDTVFFVLDYSNHKNGMIFKLKDCNSRLFAESLKTQFVFLPKQIFKSQKESGIYLMELQNFKVEVLGKETIGAVHSFQSDEFHDFVLIQLEDKTKKVLVPFIKPYVQSICFSKKNLILNLPENFLQTFAN